MNLDEMKAKTRKVRVPGGALSGLQTSVHSVDDLIDALKLADEAERKKARKMMLFFILGGLLLAFVFILSLFLPSSTNQQHAMLHRGLLALWFVALGLYAGYNARRNAKVDYSEPLSLFLDKAEKRYRFIDQRGIVFTILILPIALFSIMATCDRIKYVFQRYLDKDYLYLVPFSFYLFMLLIFILGSIFSYKNWQRDKAPYWREIKKQLAKLHLDEANPSGME